MWHKILCCRKAAKQKHVERCTEKDKKGKKEQKMKKKGVDKGGSK